MNKFAAALENKKKIPVLDAQAFIQSAASDGSMTRTDPIVLEVVEVVESTPENTPVSALQSLMTELNDLQETIKITRKKGKIERLTTSMHKEQLLKAEIIKILIEEDKGFGFSMSQIVCMLIDSKYEELVGKK